MFTFIERLRSHPKFRRLLQFLGEARAVQCSGLWGASARYIAAGLSGCVGRPLLFICPRIDEAEATYEELAFLLPDKVHLFSPWDAFAEKAEILPPEALYQRFSVLNRLEKGSSPEIIVAAIQAILQPLPSKEVLSEGTITLKVGEEFPRRRLLDFLVDAGFEPSEEVQLPGEFSTRGGIVDIFSLGETHPYRIEFFGDRVDSIRRFNIADQLSEEKLSDVKLLVLNRSRIFATDSGESTLLDWLPSDCLVLLQEAEEMQEEASAFISQAGETSTVPFRRIIEQARRFVLLYTSVFGVSVRAPALHWRVRVLPAFSREPRRAAQELSRLSSEVKRLFLFCQNEGEKKRLKEMLSEYEPDLSSRMDILLGPIRAGFVFADLKTAIVAYDDIFHRYFQRRYAKAFLPSRPIDSFLELSKGDYVVHVSHGIGRYRGMQVLQRDGEPTEYLVIEYAGGAKLYVPASSIHLVQKYVGGKGAPTLDRIGGRTWEKKKEAALRGIQDFAAEVLSLQAARLQEEGIAYPADTNWQNEFEASFLFEETPDQLQTIAEVKKDMERPRPMDRLICGDVGYGKTEIAMRAAFKAATAGKQVVVLVPTTVLAQQHYRTFVERMADYPLVIDVLSRFRSEAEEREILRRLSEGTIDILIGTHRILQDDVQFKDLGLVIIDEEQRFGVEHKEHLKRLRKMVDVLTMTATPIPRTLHMSLLGLRDISSLVTPPQDRTRIETRVTRYDTGLIREAILRELNRGGQVFFVHNRVHNIDLIAREVERAVPEATITVVHGQMNEQILEERMLAFVEGKIDVLVATTIIENGLDIPNANTIIVNDADQFGLADLHQLRGRVGRYKYRAYAYFLLPRNRPINDVARKRLKAIEDYSELGAGFRIALRDLEIRGAGNILGREQSGHIAAVGFEMYCRLLEMAIRLQKNEPLPVVRTTHLKLDVPAYLPDHYIPSERLKLEIYRKVSSVSSLSEIPRLRQELQDRFGPVPSSVENLLSKAEISLLATTRGIVSIFSQNDHLVVSGRDPRQLRKALSSLKEEVRFLDDFTAHIVLSGRRPRGGELLRYLKNWLKR